MTRGHKDVSDGLEIGEAQQRRTWCTSRFESIGTVEDSQECLVVHCIHA